VDESTATIVLGGIVQAQTLFDDMLAKIHGNEEFRVGAEYFCLAAVLLAFVLDAALDLRRHPRLHHVVCAFARRFCIRVVVVVRVVVRLPALPCCVSLRLTHQAAASLTYRCLSAEGCAPGEPLGVLVHAAG